MAHPGGRRADIYILMSFNLATEQCEDVEFVVVRLRNSVFGRVHQHVLSGLTIPLDLHGVSGDEVAFNGKCVANRPSSSGFDSPCCIFLLFDGCVIFVARPYVVFCSTRSRATPWRLFPPGAVTTR